MSRPEPKKKTPVPPTSSAAAAAAAPAPGGLKHTGSGADTALVAMLAKRQMRAGRDPEPAPPAPTEKKSRGA